MTTTRPTRSEQARAIAASVAVVLLTGCGGDRVGSGNGGGEISDVAGPGRLASGEVDVASYAASGKSLFARVCAACHGPVGAGRPRLGKPLANSAFVGSLDDEGLLAFIKKGRGPGDPGNTTGIPMPPRGGSPALSDDDLLDIITYVRTLQADTPGTVKQR